MGSEHRRALLCRHRFPVLADCQLSVLVASVCPRWIDTRFCITGIHKIARNEPAVLHRGQPADLCRDRILTSAHRCLDLLPSCGRDFYCLPSLPRDARTTRDISEHGLKAQTFAMETQTLVTDGWH